MEERTANRIEDFIKTLGRNELIYLNRLVVERLKLIAQARSTVEMSKYNLGDKVTFQDTNGSIKRGRIIKLNKKTVSLITDDNERWNVAPGLLENG